MAINMAGLASYKPKSQGVVPPMANPVAPTTTMAPVPAQTSSIGMPPPQNSLIGTNNTPGLVHSSGSQGVVPPMGGATNLVGTPGASYSPTNAVFRNGVDNKTMTNYSGQSNGMALAGGGYTPMSAEQINAMAQSDINAEFAAKQAAAAAATRAAQANYEYTQGIIRDNRVLENGNFERTNAPASWDGSTGYRGAMMDRDRSIQDTAMARDYGNTLASVNQGVQDFQNQMSGLIRAREGELTAQERAYRGETADRYGRDPITGQQTSSERQFNESNALQKGQLTGTYMSPELSDLYQGVIQAKQEYANARTPEERKAAMSRADAYRSRITQLGGDADLVASSVTIDQANTNSPRFGVQTQASKEFDANMGYKKESDKAFTTGKWSDGTATMDYTQMIAGLTGYLPNGQKTTAEQQRVLGNAWNTAGELGYVTKELSNLIGIPEGTKTMRAVDMYFSQTMAQENLALNQWQAKDSSAQGWDNNDLRWLDYETKQGESTNKGVSGTTAGTMLSQSLRKQMGMDDSGKPVYGTINDPTTREQAFLEAWNTTGVAPGTDTIEMLTKAGYTTAEIKKYKEKYPSAFNSGTGASGNYGSKSVSIPQNLRGLSSKYGKQYGVDPSLIDAVAQQESTYGKASQNVMQVNGMNQSSPEESMRTGSSMLASYMKQTGGDIEMSLAMYNMGPGIRSWMKKQGITDVRSGMAAFSKYQKSKNGYKVYGDPSYIDNVLRYYQPQGKSS